MGLFKQYCQEKPLQEGVMSRVTSFFKKTPKPISNKPQLAVGKKRNAYRTHDDIDPDTVPVFKSSLTSKMPYLNKESYNNEDSDPFGKTLNHFNKNKESGDPYYDYHELVPTKELLKYREYDRSKHEKYPGHYDSVKSQIAKNGITDAGILMYNHKTHKTYAGEGNTRISAAHELGISHVPMRAVRWNHDKGEKSPQPHPSTQTGKRVDADIKPSELGFSTYKSVKEGRSRAANLEPKGTMGSNRRIRKADPLNPSKYDKVKFSYLKKEQRRRKINRMNSVTVSEGRAKFGKATKAEMQNNKSRDLAAPATKNRKLRKTFKAFRKNENDPSLMAKNAHYWMSSKKRETAALNKMVGEDDHFHDDIVTDPNWKRRKQRGDTSYLNRTPEERKAIQDTIKQKDQARAEWLKKKGEASREAMRKKHGLVKEDQASTENRKIKKALKSNPKDGIFAAKAFHYIKKKADRTIARVAKSKDIKESRSRVNDFSKNDSGTNRKERKSIKLAKKSVRFTDKGIDWTKSNYYRDSSERRNKERKEKLKSQNPWVNRIGKN